MTLTPSTEKTLFYTTFLGNLASKDWYNTSPISQKLPSEVVTAQVSPVTETGGHFAEVFAVELTFDNSPPLSLIAKLVGSCDVSQNYQREITIYEHFLSPLQEQGIITVPKFYYGTYDAETGGKLIILEKIDSVLCGRFFGDASPHNDNTDLQSILGKYASLTDVEITRRAFIDIARLHSQYWNSTDLPSYIRGVDWVKSANAEQKAETTEISKGEEEYNIFMKFARDNWARKAERPNAEFNPYLESIIEASLAQTTWDRFNARFDPQNGHPYTILHSDFYPGNALVGKNDEKIYIIDFECCSVGSGPQDCAQWAISHLNVETRKQHELGLLKEYYESLTTVSEHQNKAVDPSQYTFDMCLKDYIFAAGKWIWLLCICAPMLDVIPDKLYQHFIVQLTDFLQTHNVKADENVPLPRP